MLLPGVVDEDSARLADPSADWPLIAETLEAAMENDIDDQFSGLGANSLTIQPGDSPIPGALGGSEGGNGGGLGGRTTPNLATVDSDATLTATDLEAIRSVPGVAAAGAGGRRG